MQRIFGRDVLDPKVLLDDDLCDNSICRILFGEIPAGESLVALLD